MFPPEPAEGSSSAAPAISPYTLLFNNPETAGKTTGTRATFKFNDANTLNAFRNCRQIDLRIERYGDLTSAMPSQPLHSFALDTNSSKAMEFELPEKLDLGISERGILGRQVTLLSRNATLGTGIVGYN